MKTNTTQHKTILLTGGHVTPAIATIETIRSKFPSWRIVFVGREHALEGNQTISEEYRLMRELKIPFVPIVAGRLKREGGYARLVALSKIPVGFFQAIAIVRRERPQIVVSFGGYVALPVAFAARVFGIPIVTHEQTARPGLANRMMSRIATFVCVTFPHTAKYFFDPQRVIVTGLPIRSDVLTPPRVCPFDSLTKKPILLIVGGSTGSVSINEIVFQTLPALLGSYTVIHQVGRMSEGKSRDVISSLPPHLKKRYVVKSYLCAVEYSWALNHAKIVIGRSGANTVVEIIAARAVAIFIPLPWSAGNEQFHNAQYIVRGGSIILPQDTLVPKTFLRAIEHVMINWTERKRLAVHLSSTLPRNGAERFVGVIERVIAST